MLIVLNKLIFIQCKMSVNFVKFQIVDSLSLCKSLISGLILHLVPYVVPLFLVCLPLVLLSKSLLILDLHVHRIVHKALILYTDRQLLDLVLTMVLLLLGQMRLVLCLLLFVIVLDSDWVEVVSLPELLGDLGSLDFVICLEFLFVVHQVPVIQDVVVSGLGHWLLNLFIRLDRVGLRPLFWSVEVVLSHRDVANDVVITQSVFFRSEIPRLTLGIVWTVLKTLQFILEIQDVISLLIS